MTDSTAAARDPDWHEKYADMIATPREAVGRIRPGQRVFVGTGCGQPQQLVLIQIF